MRRSSTASIPIWPMILEIFCPAPLQWWKNISAVRSRRSAALLPDGELITMASMLRGKCDAAIDGYQFSNALAEIWKLVARANKYIDETMPWALGKDATKRARLASVLYNLCETLRIISILIAPFMPETAPKIQQQIGAIPEVLTYESSSKWGLLSADRGRHQGGDSVPAHRCGQGDRRVEQASSGIPAEPEKKHIEGLAQIGIDVFDKVELRVAKVKSL